MLWRCSKHDSITRRELSSCAIKFKVLGKKVETEAFVAATMFAGSANTSLCACIVVSQEFSLNP